MTDQNLHSWMRGVESEEPPELWNDISQRNPRGRPPRQTPRVVRYAGVAVLSVVVAAGILLPMKVLLPLGDHDKTVQGPRGSGASPDSHWPPAPPITAEMLDLPKDWDGLTGQALADHLGMTRSDQGTCKGWFSAGWCASDAGSLTHAQEMGLLILLKGESFGSEVSQGRMASALIQDARAAGDVAGAAELNWWYIERPRALDTATELASPQPVTPAAPGEDTYVFSNIEFTYPYVPGGVEGAKPDEGFAGLSFESDWSGDTFPGDAECEARFLTADGTDVGGLTSGWAHIPRHVTRQGSGAYPVTGVPVRVTWACSAGDKPSDDVTLENLRLQEGDGGPVLRATLRAPSAGESGPGAQVCQITGTTPAGETVTSAELSIEAPDGDRVKIHLPPSFAGATNLEASCHPFTG